ALGAVNGQTLTLHGVVAGVQGKPLIRLREEGSPDEAESIGWRLAQKALSRGAAEILATK
ncbi:MAG: hydroxymethylbilane synthase, partial [Caldilineae bacterium]